MNHASPVRPFLEHYTAITKKPVVFLPGKDCYQVFNFGS